MRLRLRQVFVIGLTLSLLGIGVPAWSQDDPKSCNDLLSADTPAYVVCTWMATPEEALDIAKFWLDNDSENLKEAGPLNPILIDCSEDGNVCPTDSEGDGELHDVDGPDVPGAEDGGTPECQNGESCFVDGNGLSAAEKAAAMETPAGKATQTVAPTGMRVWIETELADDFKAGKLAEAAKKIAALAVEQPNVVGVRFTSQLGYNQNFATAEELDKFVTEATTALRALLPGKKMAAHTVVPVFGCGANDACKAEITKKYPLIDPDRIGSWLAKGTIDQLSLDSGHLGTEFATWKIDAAEAQRNQWIQVRARAWDAYAQIAAEDASFAATGTAKLTEEQATKAITERIATPLQDDAAETVTLWTRWQNDQGQVSRVYGEKWAANVTWEQLKKLATVRPRLATVYDPAKPEVDLATDLKNLSEVFGQVYLHAS
ncbi:hypothetical protein SAMN05444920_121109 [Nonomuraea solani]|uniref:Uncharacterized protein n=1 Tax=Nonomuraea solani TaxID=1144553 RepID=A0A1H6EX37_9ACTN|nr:hypothetical protein [Nonomuraea solani]SEH01661.1 hypothetical protein SAMN05444920_121109 [Nonomuraea solani]